MEEFSLFLNWSLGHFFEGDWPPWTYLEAVLCVFAKPILVLCSGRMILSRSLEVPCRRKKINKVGKQIIKAI